MLLSRGVKKVIAGTAGVTFLLCYSVGIAHGCSTIPTASKKSEMPPCHMMMGDESDAPPKSTTSITSNCHDIAAFEVDHSTPDWSHIFVVAVVDPYAAPVSGVQPFQPPSLRVKPPPLRLLHCCLRN